MSVTNTSQDCAALPQCHFGDPRLERRAEQLFHAIGVNPQAQLKQLATTRAEQVAYGRLLRNPKVTIDAVDEGIVRETHQRLQQAEHEHLLLVSDTTEVNLQDHHGYHVGYELGVTGNNADSGFFIHQGIAPEPH